MFTVQSVSDLQELKRLYHCAEMYPTDPNIYCSYGAQFPSEKYLEETLERPSIEVFALYEDEEPLAFSVIDLYSNSKCEWQVFCVDNPANLFSEPQAPMKMLVDYIINHTGNFHGEVENPVLQERFAKLTGVTVVGLKVTT